MADYTYAGVLAIGSLVLENTDGTLIPAAGATVTILDADSDVPTYYTNRAKGGTTTPDFITDATGIVGPFFVDPGTYTYTVVDAEGNTHPASGAYTVYVGPDAEEPTVDPVDYTAVAHTLVSGTPWQNTNPYAVSMRIPVAYAATSGAVAELQIGVAATSEGSAGNAEIIQPVNSLAQTITTRVIVPPGYWLRADTAHATIAAGDYTPVVA